jgi:hypothetical protein
MKIKKAILFHLEDSFAYELPSDFLRIVSVYEAKSGGVDETVSPDEYYIMHNQLVFREHPPWHGVLILRYEAR